MRPIVVTGATGWIGQALLDIIAAERAPDWARGVTLFGSSARAIAGPAGVPAMRDLLSITPADVEGAHVVHLAWLGKEKVAALGEARFTAANRAIDGALLAALAEARPASLFVASSGAAALAADGRDPHSYGREKLEQEARFLGWAAAAGVPTLVGRIFNLAGPHINKLGSYALADFLIQARRDGRIRITADARVLRAYLHVGDLARLILRAGAAGEGAPAPMDLCGDEVVEMADIARAAARAVGLPENRIERPPINSDRASTYLGDPAATRALAARLGIALSPFARQVAETAEWLA